MLSRKLVSLLVIRPDLAINPASAISEKEVTTDLRPYLSQGRVFDLSEARRTVGDFCHELFKLESNELEFLRNLFEKRKYAIDLLFPDADRIRDHPGMKWRLQHLSPRLLSEN